MAIGFHRSKRRSILKSGAIVLAGAMGLGGLSKESVAEAASAESWSQRLKENLHGNGSAESQ